MVLTIIVQLDNRKEYEAVAEAYEPRTDILSSFSLNFNFNSSDTIHVAPNTETVKDIITVAAKIWEDRGDSQTNLTFVFYDSEEDLISAYFKGLIELAVVFTESSQLNIQYKIRTSPDNIGFSLPGASNLKADLSTCRDLKEKSMYLEYPSSCPVNAYYYTNFLGLQGLLDEAILRVSFTRRIFRLI